MSLKLFILLQLCNVYFVSCAVSKTCLPGTIAPGANAELCYRFVKTAETFEAAKLACHKDDGRLVKIKDEQTNLVIKDLASKNFESTPNFWIGGKNVNVPSINNYVWTWTDDGLIKYFNWIAESEGYHSDKKCISVHSDDASWSSANCSTTLPYICQIPLKTPVCDSGWALFEQNYKCYKSFSKSTGIERKDAENKCVKFGGHLPSIHSQAENDFLVELTSVGRKGYWADVGVWTGGLSDGNNTWSWADGSPFDFTNWSPANPDRVTRYAFIAIYPDGEDDPTYQTRWDDVVDGDKLKRYVCQKNAIYA